MSFVNLKQQRRKYPRRFWAIFGPANSGKSTLCAQMESPLIWVDSDQRADEIVGLVEGEIYGLSDDPYDNTIPERIDGLLVANMPGIKAGTIVIDSVTAILEPIITRIQADVDAGRVKNKAGAWRPKASAMKMLHNLQRFGSDVVMIYHEYKALDANGSWRQSRTISELEEARMVKSLNMLLRTVRDGDGRFYVEVVWARNGRSGIKLYDETGHWQGMPERIEAAVYDNLTDEEQAIFGEEPPETFPTPPIAWAWAMHQVPCPFRDEAHAQNAYEKIKRERKPKTAREMRDLWVTEVVIRMAAVETEPAEEAPDEGETEQKTLF